MNVNESYLLDILSSLAEKEIKFIVCGGVAAARHGVERMTMDIDISLEMSPGNLEKFLSVMKEIGLTPRAPVPPESLMDKKKIEFFIKKKNAIVFTFWDTDRPYRQLDVFLTEDMSYDILIKDTVTDFVGGKPVRIISIEKLIEMKSMVIPQREKDKSDIAELKKILGVYDGNNVLEFTH